MIVRLFLVLLLGGLAGLSMLSCQQNTPPAALPREVVSVVLVVDSSTSSGTTTNTSLAELRCSEVAGSVERLLLQTKRLDVLVLATGSARTGQEPRIILPWLRYAPTFKQFGPMASKAVQAETFLRALRDRCRSTLTPENSSPIVAAVGRGALSLTSHCAELATRREVCSSRQLVLISDLRENVHAGVRERLVAVSKALRLGKPLPPRPAMLPTIALEGHLAVCGLSEHVAGKDDLAVSPEAVVMVWRELFDREVAFDAACPRWELTQPVMPVGGAR